MSSGKAADPSCELARVGRRPPAAQLRHRARNMHHRHACILLACVFASGFARCADLPKELVGVWATAPTEFDGDRLIGGEALYLMAAGKAALVGAPLPVKRCADGKVCTPIIGVGGVATFDARSGRVAIALQDGQRSQVLEAQFDPAAGVISLDVESDRVARFLRRGRVVPKALEANLNGHP